MALKTNTTLRRNDGNLTADDPVLDLAHRIAAADAYLDSCERKESDAAQKKDHMSEAYFKTAQQHAFDQYYALKDGLSCHEAKSMAGAMVQVAESFSLLDQLWDMMPEGPQDKEGKKIKRAIDRMLMSSLRTMERFTGNDLRDMGLGCFRNANLDPWEDVERRISDVREAM